MFTRRNMLYLLLIALSVAVYFFYQNSLDRQSMTTIDLSEDPIYQSRQARSSFYAITGKIDHVIEANDVKHYEYDNHSTFVKPKMTFFNAESIAHWEIICDEATLQDDDLILSGKVVIKNLLEESKIHRIITRDVRIDLPTKVAVSEAPVTIIGTQFLSTGVGVISHLVGQTSDILHDVKTQYFTIDSAENAAIFQIQ